LNLPKGTKSAKTNMTARITTGAARKIHVTVEL